MKDSIIVLREMACIAAMLICLCALIFSFSSCGTVHKITSETENGITKHSNRTRGMNVEYLTVKREVK
jgi:hypothetical protein